MTRRVSSSNEAVLASLKKQFSAKTDAPPGHLRLPRGIDFQLEDRVLSVHAENPAENVQTNAAAFEAWILALKVWLSDDIDQVVMDYSVPRDMSRGYVAGWRRAHYNRFLFRIHGFSALFGDWFVLPADKHLEVSAFMDWLRRGPSLVNHPLAQSRSVVETDKMERQIESWFTFEGGKPILANRLGLDPDKIFNQLPVGVFHEKIAADTAVFTRGSSAIDMWGIGTDGMTLHLIELKCGNNKNLGIISEVLFYAQVIYEACMNPHGYLSFGRWGNGDDERGIDLLRGKKYPRMQLSFLAEHFHPLFDNGVLSVLDNALSVWNAAAEQHLYDYESRQMF